MPLQEISLQLREPVLDARQQRFVDDAGERIRQILKAPEHVPAKGLVPSDELQVCAGLQAVRALEPSARRFLEWGSGLGVATGIAELMGFDAYGIEIERDLVDASRQLLVAHALRAPIVHGSFVPDDFEDSEHLSDLESRIVLHGEPAYVQMDLDLDDFDVVFAYPWPTEVELYLRIFEHGADHGALLLLASREEGAMAWRKVAAS